MADSAAQAHFWGTQVRAGKYRDVEIPVGACLRLSNVVAEPGSKGVLTLYVRTEDINEEPCRVALAVMRPGVAGGDNVSCDVVFCSEVPMRLSVKATGGGAGSLHVSGYFEEEADGGDDDDDDEGGLPGFGGDDDDEDDELDGDDDEEEDDEDDLDDDDDEAAQRRMMLMGGGDDDEEDDDDDEDDDEIPGADELKPGTQPTRGALGVRAERRGGEG